MNFYCTADRPADENEKTVKNKRRRKAARLRKIIEKKEATKIAMGMAAAVVAPDGPGDHDPVIESGDAPMINEEMEDLN